MFPTLLFDPTPTPLTPIIALVTVPENPYLTTAIGFLVFATLIGIIRWFRTIFY